MSRIPSKFVPLNGGGGWGDHSHSLAELRPEDRRRMNIDRDDAEAGSILISLAGHHQEQPSVERRRSMSIQSLLGTTEQPQRLNHQYENHVSHDYSSANEHRRDDFHARVSIRPGPKPNSHNSNYRQQPMNMLERMLHSPPAAKQHPVMKSSQSESMAGLDNYSDLQKQTPKIRRNALHAYISYMIYTDLTNQQKPLNVKLTPPKETATFAVAMKNNSDQPSYPFPSMPLQKMNSVLSQDFRRAEPHYPSSSSVPSLAGNWNVTQDPPSSSITHKPLTAYLHTTWPETHESAPSEEFRPRPYASVPLLPGMPPNHGRRF